MNLNPLTYLTAEKGSPIFKGASVIKAEKQTPGEIGRRKAQLGAVVDKALEEKSALLILPGEFEPGVQFELVSKFDTLGSPNAEPSNPFAEAEADLAKREKVLASGLASAKKLSADLEEDVKKVAEREHKAAEKEAELTEREADLVAREKKVKASEKKAPETPVGPGEN